MNVHLLLINTAIFVHPFLLEMELLLNSYSSSIIVDGTVAQYSCTTDYRLSGKDTRICENIGTGGVWSNLT